MLKKYGAYINYILLVFLVLGLELAIAQIELMIYGLAGVGDFNFTQKMIHWAITIAVWLTGTIWIYKDSQKHGIKIFNLSNTNITVKDLTLIGVMVVIVTVFMAYIWGGQIKPVAEFLRSIENFGTVQGLIVFSVQMIYYVVEAWLIVLIVAYGQKMVAEFGVLPSFLMGAVAPALTWGLGHILSKDLGTMLLCMIMSFAFSFCFLKVQKSLKYGIIVTAILFIL